MTQATTRIQPTDTFTDIAYKLTEGNPGALTVCINLIRNEAEIDPQSAFCGMGCLLSLDQHEIYASNIWILAKYVLLLRSVQLGITRESEVLAAIEKLDADAFDFEAIAKQVKAELDDFQWPYEPDSAPTAASC